ncbi:MAG: DUF2235 domain-containing protein [Acidobacteriota bacterium]
MALYAFDGTWNEDEEKATEDSNVIRFRDLYEGPVEYRAGVGTRFGHLGRVLGGLFGVGGRSRIEEMYDALRENWSRGDQVVDVVGFSRGSALAIHFCNVLAERGFDTPSGERVTPPIRFLGLFDTVASFGLSFDINHVINFQDINVGWNVEKLPTNVQRCFHALALDERRESFRPTRPEPESADTQLVETWFRGVHSDIGGGNGNVERNDIALAWMLRAAHDSGLPVSEDAIDAIEGSADLQAPIAENLDPKKDERRAVGENDDIHPSAKSTTLAVGESHEFDVRSEYKLDWSGLRMEAGAIYEFEVPGDQAWTDKGIRCDANGWKTERLRWFKEPVVRALESRRRVPDADWFELCGSAGDDEDRHFRIGKGGPERRYSAEVDADLYCFANDLTSKYDNNEGELAVVVKRVS